MRQVHCDCCSTRIEGEQLSKTGAQVRVEGVDGFVTATFSFRGKAPDLCNTCLVKPFASLVGITTNVVALPLGNNKNSPQHRNPK